MQPLPQPYKKQQPAIYIIIILGVFLRLYFYFQNRSLWLDEVYLSNSIVSYNIKQLLTQPLLYYQKAPLGFLAMQKFFITIFPPGHFSLRVFPIFCGIASIFIFTTVCRHFLHSTFIWVALAIMCLAPPLIFHSAEAKQYSCELLACLLALLLYIHLQTHIITPKRILLLGFAGACLIWFSYSVIFILVAVAISLSVKMLYKKNFQYFLYYLIPFFLWMISFLINYYFSTYRHAQSEWTVYWFDFYKHFMPLPPKNIDDISWFAIRFYRMLDYPLGLLWNFMVARDSGLAPLLKMAWVPIIFALAGIISYKKREADIAVLLFAIVLTLLASGLKLYPLHDRFWVFLSPVFIIFIVAGCQYVTHKYMPEKLWYILPLLLITGPLLNASVLFTNNKKFMANKTSQQLQVLQHVQNRRQPGDLVYIYWSNIPAYRLYKNMGIIKFDALLAKDYRSSSKDFSSYIERIKQDIKQQGCSGVWIIFNDTFQSDIGEPVDWPKWYFGGAQKPSDKIVAALSKQWKLAETYNDYDIDAFYFIINE